MLDDITDSDSIREELRMESLAVFGLGEVGISGGGNDN